MKTKAFFCLTALLCASQFLQAQAPPIAWKKCLGGTLQDVFTSIQHTSDGGYIAAGFSISNDGDLTANNGYIDYWVLKLTSTGGIEWQKNFGGDNQENAYSIQQTADGGFIVAGFAYSNDQDVSQNHGGGDFWIVKLNSAGTIQWQKTFGGSLSEIATSILQTADGGYIVAGCSISSDGDVMGHYGEVNTEDWWIIKLSSTGSLEWQKVLGGDHNERPHSMQITEDGGYIIAGYTRSVNGDVNGNHGDADCWVVKLNSTGNMEWQKCLGGSGYDEAYSVALTTDGGYIIAGFASSFNGDVSGNHGGPSGADCWIVKLTSTGVIQWQKCLGGTGGDYAVDIKKTADGGYIVAGVAGSNDGDISGNHIDPNGLYSDYWVVKLNNSGSIQWQKCLGGGWEDIPASILQDPDGGYTVAGYTTSDDYDVTGYHGDMDGWIVKLGTDPATPVSLLNFTAKSTGEAVAINWQTTTELNSSYFNVQRSNDGINFQTIGKYSAVGNSSTYQSYSFTDVTASSQHPVHNSLYYRLQSVDKNGTTSLSKVVTVSFLSKREFVIVHTSGGEIRLQYQSPADTKAIVQVLDISGRVFLSMQIKLRTGQHILDIPTQRLTAGTYILKVQEGNNLFSQKFVK